MNLEKYNLDVPFVWDISSFTENESRNLVDFENVVVNDSVNDFSCETWWFNVAGLLLFIITVSINDNCLLFIVKISLNDCFHSIEYNCAFNVYFCKSILNNTLSFSKSFLSSLDKSYKAKPDIYVSFV